MLHYKPLQYLHVEFDKGFALHIIEKIAKLDSLSMFLLPRILFGGLLYMPENCCINIFIFIIVQKFDCKQSFIPYDATFLINAGFMFQKHFYRLPKEFLSDSLKSREMLQTP